jgi:hypothetical protein
MSKSRPLPGLPVDSSAPDDAPTTVGIKELVDDSLTVTAMYRDLAKRHDELVDAVNKFLHKQAN